MTVINKGITKGNRIHWMDNLRTVIIFLVVLYHVGGVYEAGNLWGWFWIVDDPDTITWVGIMGIVFDVFIMPTMFFIAGYLTPISLKKKTGWGFLKSKFKRLMIPWVIAVLTLIPLYKVIFLYSRGLPQENWSTYFHVTNPNSQNWLWFLPVLFCFDLLYLLFSKLNLRFPKLTFKTALLLSFLFGFICSFFMGSLFGFRSWTLTPLIDFENERIFLYFFSFLLGALAFQKNIFAEKSRKKTLYIVASSIAWVPVTAHIFVRLVPFFSTTEFVVTPGYRLLWHFSFYLSLLCMMYLMIESFRRYVNRTGKIWNELALNSYGVYIIHVILIGVFGTILLYLNWPALVKYLLLILLTYLGSNLLVSFYRFVIKTLKKRQVKSEETA